MHAVFSVVDIDAGRHDAAIQWLNEHMIPGLRQAPGFVSGMWFGDGTTGHGVVMFETKDQAQQAQQAADSMVLEGVRLVRSEVYQVDAQA